jgi:hypothetical protein
MANMRHICMFLVLPMIFLTLEYQPAYSQTCCSGGVPLSGNIGFEGASTGTLQMEWSYDLNYLATLKTGSEVYEDGTRQRTTQSLLLKTGYSLTSWLAFDALFSYVFQERKITFDNEINQVNTNGLGDAVLMAKFILLSMAERGSELQLGLGPKLPLGRSDLTNSQGITLNADMQPGSGSWDAIAWGYYARQMKPRPTMAASLRIVGRFNGKNRDYLGSQTYQFGSSVQVYAGIGDQLVWGNQVFSPSLSLRYRYAGKDLISGFQLDNTGGQWVNILPALSWHLSPNSILHVVPEIPLYSHVGGTQLTPTFRLQIGFYHSFGRIGKNKSKNVNYEI